MNTNQPKKISEIQSEPAAQRERIRRNTAFVATSKASLTREEAQRMIPKIRVIDPSNGELKEVYKYKIWCEWKDEFLKDPEKPDYQFPDYLILQKYWQIHGKIPEGIRSFIPILRAFLQDYEPRCKRIIVYDNTPHVTAGVIYKSILETGKPIATIHINYIFPSRIPYTQYPI